jgi:hypothetical protein
MKIRRLQIESQQMARISVQAQMARLSISMPIRRIKAVQQHRAQMTVSRKNPSLEVDMESLRNNIGLKSIGTLTREIAAQSFAQARQGTKNIENNGDYVAALPHEGNPIAQISRTAMLRTKTVSAPAKAADPTVSIKGNPGSIKINWSLQDVSIIWDEYQTPIITVDPKPSVNIVMAQEPRLEFKVVEHSYPPESGRTVNEEI